MNKFILNIPSLLYNIASIKKCLKADTLFCAMVKANAYGHGLKAVCQNIQHAVDYFGVACVTEGLKLRQFNIGKPILVVGAYDKNSANKAVINQLTLTVFSCAQIEHLTKTCKKLNMCAYVHIKINTGMNRLGVNKKAEFVHMLKLLINNRFIKLAGVFSHLAREDKLSIKKQNREFLKYKKLCKGFKGIIFHLSSSFAAVNYSEFNYDMVRIGLAMYGYCHGNIKLKPAISVISNVCSVIDVKKGEFIGYGDACRCPKNMTVATVPLGYADGINLKLSNQAIVHVVGKPAQVVGRICMDMLMIDTTNLGVKIGDEVIIFDNLNNASVWSALCGNHEYEILTSFKTNRMRAIVKK